MKKRTQKERAELFQYNSGVTTELPQSKPTPATLDSIVEKWFCSPKPDSTREAMKQACLEYAATVLARIASRTRHLQIR